MLPLVLGCLVFLGIHVFVSGTALRGRLVGLIGAGPYRGLFAVLSLGALGWIVQAYKYAPFIELWPDSAAAHLLNLALNLAAIPLIVLGVLSPNPTSVGQERLMRAREPARGVIRITRHPFLVGVALWAAGHLVANGDLAALTLFGSLLLLALIGPRLIDAKKAARDQESWQRLAAATSWLPFAAILQGRNRLVLAELGWWRVVLAVAAYLAIVFYLHEMAFGPMPLPG